MKLFKTPHVTDVVVEEGSVSINSEAPLGVMVEHVLEDGKCLYVLAIKRGAFNRKIWAVSHKLPLIVAMAPDETTGFKFNGRKIHWMRNNAKLRKASRKDIIVKPHFKLLP